MKIYTRYNIYRMDMDATKNKDIIRILKIRDIDYSINEIIYNNDINTDKNKITGSDHLADTMRFFNKMSFKIIEIKSTHEVMLTTYAIIKETTYDNITVKRLICMTDIDEHSVETLKKIFKNYDEEANRKYHWKLRGGGWFSAKYLNVCLSTDEIMIANKQKSINFETEFTEKEYVDMATHYRFSRRAFEKEEIDSE